MQTLTLAPHELMEVHELLNLKTICAAKSKGLGGLVTDPDLKKLLDEDVQQAIQALSSIEALLQQVNIEQ